MGNVRRLTKEEFEKQYAEGSGLTIEELKKYRLYAVPCDCGQGEGKGRCRGWKMAHRRHLNHNTLYDLYTLMFRG